MTFPTLPQLVIDALRSAGATEAIIAAAIKASGECAIPHPSRGGRPRKYADRAARDRAYRAQKKPRVERRVETPPRDEMRVETRTEWDEMRDEMRVETLTERPVDEEGGKGNRYLWARLDQASRGHADPGADVAPIRALLDQGCDLEAAVVPTVARTVPAAMHCLRVSYRADADAVVCSLAITA